MRATSSRIANLNKAKSRGSGESGAESGAHSRDSAPHAVQVMPSEPERAAIVAAWPELPPAVRDRHHGDGAGNPAKAVAARPANRAGTKPPIHPPHAKGRRASCITNLSVWAHEELP
jgi:hypothetical protein